MFLPHRSGTLIRVMLLLVVCRAAAQQKIVRMPPPVNHPAINTSSPFISFDGKGLLFISDNTDGNVPAVFYTSSPDEVNWKAPVILPRTINNKLNYLRGFSLSPDGKRIFITSTKNGGVGGYDIYYSDQRGAYWSDPQPIGLPINSVGNDASPTVTADGLQLYFMRCEKMDPSSGSGCKILMSTRRTPTTQWTEPVALPPNINTGNSQTPRIMSDGETLIFASDKFPGKGGMDLFLTRREGDTWSEPIALEFVNTPGNNQFVSATSTGRYLMTEMMGRMATELVQLLFPPDVKPKGVMKIEGKVVGLNPPTAGYVNLFDADTFAKINSVRPDNTGSFLLYMKEGTRYTVTVDPEQDNFTFYIRDFDLKEGKVNTIEKMEATLKPLAAGDEMVLSRVAFKPYTAELEESSKLQLDKVARMMKGNPGSKFAIEVDLYGFMKDSIASDSDLTESVQDTAHYTVTQTQIDSTGMQVVNSHDSVAVITTYHNDRTVEQALQIVNYLIEQGVPSSGLLPLSRVFEAVPEERKTLVRVTVR
jgi:hypothetical protein